MADEGKFGGNGKNEKRGEIKVPPRNWLLWILILGCIPLLMVFHERRQSSYTPVTRQQLIKLVDKGLIKEGSIQYNPQSSVLQDIKGKFYKHDKDWNRISDEAVDFKIRTHLTEDLEKKLLDEAGFTT